MEQSLVVQQINESWFPTLGKYAAVRGIAAKKKAGISPPGFLVADGLFFMTLRRDV